jgi:SAM-dependent methyltransferase
MVQRHYQGEAGRRYQQLKRAVPERAIPWVARLRAEKISPFIGANDVVLEYGAGFGWNLLALSCRRKLAFDLSDFIAPSVRAAGVEFIADCATLPDGSVEVVLCHHTLEHVPHPAAVLEEFRRLLSAKGKLLLFAPNERERRYEHYNRDNPNHHLYSWTVQTLGCLAEESGFCVTQAGIGPFGYARLAAVWADRLHVGERGFRSLRWLARLLRPMTEIRIVAVKDSSGIT